MPALDAPGKGLPQRLERGRQQLALGQRVHGVVGVWLHVLAADPDDVAAGAGVGKQLLGGGRRQRRQIDTENHGLAGNVVRDERFGCQRRGPERPADRAAGSERSFQVEGVVGLRHLAAAGLDDRQRYLLIDAHREIEAVIQRGSILLDQSHLAPMHALPVQGEAELVLERSARRQAEVGADRFPGAVDLQFQVLLLGHSRAVEHLDGGLKGYAGDRCRAGEGDRLKGHVGRRFAVDVDNDHGGWERDVSPASDRLPGLALSGLPRRGSGCRSGRRSPCWGHPPGQAGHGLAGAWRRGRRARNWAGTGRAPAARSRGSERAARAPGRGVRRSARAPPGRPRAAGRAPARPPGGRCRTGAGRHRPPPCWRSCPARSRWPRSGPHPRA